MSASQQPPTPENTLLFQSFEWHTASTPSAPHETYSATSHWSRLRRLLPPLRGLGVTDIWLPPGCKANNPQGNGYDCYDLWDLGEFDQKWARSTKWGSREELGKLILGCEELGMSVIWDAVLNHRTAGDALEECWAVEVDGGDRRVEICPPRKIEAWLKYDFPGRDREGMKYSKLKWRAEHFNGTDWDQRGNRNALYKIVDDPATFPKPDAQQLPFSSKPTNRLRRFAGAVSDALADRRPVPTRRPGKGWAEDVDKTHGNYDYLIFSNIYYAHPEVREDVLSWGRWMIEETGVHGFRLDAAQHFSWNFSRQWIDNVQHASRQRNGRDAFVVGEVWAAEVSRITNWLDAVTPPGSPVLAHAFDAPLLYSFSRVSEDVRRGSKNADLRTLLAGPAGQVDKQALVALRPQQAVTFVTNHDTQPGQTSHVPVDAKVKALFYSFVLLRQEGRPCVFWGDLYGTRGKLKEAPACQLNGRRSLLPDLMLARKLFAYGPQKDYIDSMSCIGWTRAGTHDRPGCVVIMSIGEEEKWAIKRMVAGQPGEKWVDILSEEQGRPEVVIDKKGVGLFTCRGKSVAVYVKDDCQEMRQFPVREQGDVYTI